jgi:CDP-paratose 2-epimerase
VIFAGTNKVYGALEDLEMIGRGRPPCARDARLRTTASAEDRPLDFRTPYGCSKGVADQYVLDYARSYGVPTAVLRMSCVYGPRQFGTEDQGWVAHFLIRALEGGEIAIYGDGRQVRDILHVSDAVRAYLLHARPDRGLAGRAFNLGGGAGQRGQPARGAGRDRADHRAGPCAVTHHDWRPGDQPWFVADTRALSQRHRLARRGPWRAGFPTSPTGSRTIAAGFPSNLWRLLA